MQKITAEDQERFKNLVQENLPNKFNVSVHEFIEKYNLKSKYDIQSMEDMIAYMLYVWGIQKNRFSEETLYDMISYIFNFEQIERDIEEIKKYIPENNPYILDTGCSWGTLAIMLKNYTDNLYTIDHVPEHATVTAMRIPEVNSYFGDARRMEFEPNFFDLIISRGVIEHIGDYSRPRGRVDAVNYAEKLRYMQSCADCLKNNGVLWLSTGNFDSIANGEVNDFFSHWLDGEHYERYLQALNTSHDRYWLLRWEQMEQLASDSGFVIEKVISPDPSAILNFKETLEKLGKSPCVAEIIADQAKTDPRLMDNWMIVLRKKAKEISFLY